ncbi:MAG: glycosyltransferase family 2 protein [Rhizobiales bacterium]|nr:glycosyltransferase family 2 protein [Hyphomicrobiales bacterium]
MRGMADVAATDHMAHHQALEVLAARALAEGDAEAAFALADRRCRIRPAPEAHSFVLRAEIHFHLGRRRFALGDIEQALAVAPGDVAANRRMLAWGRGSARLQAARMLLSGDRDLATLLSAMAALEESGERNFAALQVFDRTVRGWVAWPADEAASVSIAGDMSTITTYVEPDPFHPFAIAGRNAATFEIARPEAEGPQAVQVAVAGVTCLSVGAPPNARLAEAAPRADAPPFDGVTVIVPVYGDYDATRACLDRLAAELDAGRHRAIVVDDAGPDPRMAPYLRKLAAHPAITLLANPVNLGFVAAVNRALAAAPSGDVILLNADTIPPAGFIDRLAVAARSDDGIGIVTALSNDAEMTSFPVPGRADPLGSPEEALALDRIAAEVNAGRLVDLPSGTGFCLYLTRRCLDAIGHLSAAFHRGYLEDVELCLRARHHGFRTVCDTSIFVGHAGSRSFGAEKAALALRNFAVLAASHPSYVAECAAFADADPLRPARAAIELRAATTKRWSLIVTGSGSVAAIARRRAGELAGSETPALLLTITAGRTATLAGADGGLPQSLAFDVVSPDGLASLVEALAAFVPATIEIFDPLVLPAPLADRLATLGHPLHLVVADGGLATVRGTALLDRAASVIAPTPEAFAFAEATLAARHAGKLTLRAGRAPARSRRPRGSRDARRLGIAIPVPDAAARSLVATLAIRLRDTLPAASLVLLADLPDVPGLARHGNVVAAGAVEPGELAALADHYRLGRLFVERRRALFGHPLDEAARASGLPLAFRDWSRRGAPTGRTDLALDADASPEDAAAALVRWMT